MYAYPSESMNHLNIIYMMTIIEIQYCQIEFFLYLKTVTVLSGLEHNLD